MNKKIVLFTIIAGLAYITLSSSHSGGGAGSGYDCTGAETGLSNGAGCSCHGSSATTGISVALELDSMGIATTHYKRGMTYKVKITGTNNTTTNLPKFGFQIASIVGTSTLVTPVNAGTWSTTLPTGTRYTPATATYFVTNMVEQSMALTATTGTGGIGTTYIDSFSWTAPAAGTGSISFWGVVNAVNGTGSTGGDSWNTTHINIDEWSSVGVKNVENNINVNVYPNPVINVLNINMQDAIPGNYSVDVYDMNGRLIATDIMENNSANTLKSLNTTNWIPGLYQVLISKDGISKVISVTK